MASATVRWSILATLLGATLIAMFYPVDDAGTPPRTRAPRTPKPVQAVPPPVATVPVEEERANVDPFAPRSWQAKPVEAPVVAAVVPPFIGPMRPPPPAPAPALPFQYMGSFSDGGAAVVYLSRGDQTLIARPGETLENMYKILDITPARIDFLHLPTGEKQSMNLPAPSN